MPPSSSSSVPPSEQPRVLVVDDEQVIREILADFLSMEGFLVRTAPDGSAALAELSRGSFDLVLSDLKMPSMGGLELLEAIRKHTPSVVTVIMTGFGTVETAIDAMKRGAYDYILKPFKVDEVVHTIRRGLEKQRLQAENLRLKEALSLYKVTEAIAASVSLEDVLRTVVDSAVHELGADAVAVFVDDGEGGFFRRAARSVPSLVGESTESELLDLDTDAVARALEQPFFVRVHGRAVLPFYRTQPPRHTPDSLLVASMRIRNRTTGFVATVSFTAGKRFDEGQRKLLSIITGRAAASIESSRLYEDLKATFQQTIRGLASAIDKMDRYTAGHSERVAAYAQILAIKLGLPGEQIEIVRQSALMHDIGKIGCVLNLNKPGKLSEPEYEIFQRHPAYGRDILEPIQFLHPLIPGVHLHHERWDGHGYPLGLKGQEIPLVARIIAVADTYDAMTSDRAYRPALPHDVATAEILRCAGTQFDRDLAHDFVQRIEAHRADAAARGESVPE